jgi:hypothetical protein
MPIVIEIRPSGDVTVSALYTADTRYNMMKQKGSSELFIVLFSSAVPR